VVCKADLGGHFRGKKNLLTLLGSGQPLSLCRAIAVPAKG